MSGGSFAAPGMFMPVYAGNLSEETDTVIYKGRCFKEIEFKFVKRSDTEYSIFVTASDPVEQHKCAEWLLVANHTMWKTITVFEAGTV